MFPFSRKIIAAIVLCGGIAYPVLVYFGMPFLSPGIFVIVALSLILLRLLIVRKDRKAQRWLAPLVLSAVVLLILAMIDPEVAVKAHPVLLSLTVAFVFGSSLVFPPTIIEGFARMTNAELSEDGVAYTRVVTQIWTVFLVLNAAIAAAIGMWGTLEQWTLWTGLLSYLAMGVLFVGEFCIRRLYLRRI